KGAGYGWLLVGCGTAASIGGNVAHAPPNLVAQGIAAALPLARPALAEGIAAAIPLAVLAMLEGLKGDVGEVTRVAAHANLDATSPLQEPAADRTTVRRMDAAAALDAAAADGSRVRQLPARPIRANTSA